MSTGERKKGAVDHRHFDVHRVAAHAQLAVKGTNRGGRLDARRVLAKGANDHGGERRPRMTSADVERPAKDEDSRSVAIAHWPDKERIGNPEHRRRRANA